jgi:hypothetical protein
VFIIDIQITSFTLLEIAKVARQGPNNSSNTLLRNQDYKFKCSESIILNLKFKFTFESRMTDMLDNSPHA